MKELRLYREHVDYRLLWVRFLQKIWIIPVVTILIMFLTAGAYYFSKVIAEGGRTYQTESIFHIDFDTDGQGKEYDYYNYFTWSEVIHTDFFMNQLSDKMEGTIPAETLVSYVSATVDSDVRYLYVRCNTHESELSLKLADAMEEIVPDFATNRKEIAKIELVKEAATTKDSTKLRMGNAFFLGICLGLFVSIFSVLLYLLTDTAAYLPDTLEQRYGIPCLGAKSMPEFTPNCVYLLGGAKKVALVNLEGDSLVQDNVSSCLRKGNAPEIFTFENPIIHPENLDAIRTCDRILICVEAGRKNDESLRRLLEQLNRQDIIVTGSILVNESEKLIHAYYRSLKV